MSDEWSEAYGYVRSLTRSQNRSLKPYTSWICVPPERVCKTSGIRRVWSLANISWISKRLVGLCHVDDITVLTNKSDSVTVVWNFSIKVMKWKYVWIGTSTPERAKTNIHRRLRRRPALFSAETLMTRRQGSITASLVSWPAVESNTLALEVDSWTSRANRRLSDGIGLGEKENI